MKEVYRVSWLCPAGTYISDEEYQSVEAADLAANRMFIDGTKYTILKEIKRDTAKKVDNRCIAACINKIKFRVTATDEYVYDVAAFTDYRGVRLFSLHTHNHWNNKTYNSTDTVQSILNDMMATGVGYKVEVIEG